MCPESIKLVITPSTQQRIQLVIDEDVFIEKPWKSINKDLIEVDLELYEERSCFNQFKEEILAFSKNKLLLRCLTESAKQHVEDMIAKKER